MSAETRFPSHPSRSSESAESVTHWSKHLLLFGLTMLCVFQQGAAMKLQNWGGSLPRSFVDPEFLAHGASFAVPLLAILVTHEFGHFFAARLHGVPASLPYFLPAPVIGPGTLGAVIAMQGPIRSRKALLDVGASGPIAGMVVAVPVLLWGLAHSEVLELGPSGYQQEGQSLLYAALKYAVYGPIPPGHDVLLHPTAFAGWFGLLLTMINLLPWGQLDGGHVAYALFGERQHTLARWFRRSLLVLFAYNLATFVLPVLLGKSDQPIGIALMNSSFWLLWFGVLGLLARFSGGPEHPPFEPGELGPGRRIVAWACLVLFVLLFMPTPMAVY